MAAANYQQDREGNIIDPPILGDHERRITEAQASGDDALVHALQQRYHDERAQIVGEIDDADDDEPDPRDVSWPDDVNDDDQTRDFLTRNNTYEDLRNAARSRGLDTKGGKIDLAQRLSAHAAEHGTSARAADGDGDGDDDDQ